MKQTARTLSLVAALALSTASAEKVTLQWYDYWTTQPDLGEALQKAFDKYHTLNPDVEVKRTVINFGDLKTKLVQAAATKTLPDIVLIDNPDHQAFAAQGIFADITDQIKKTNYGKLYYPSPWGTTVYNGKNYGVPFGSNATALYYNVEMLKAAGYSKPPSTWTQLKSYAKKLTANGHYGFCFSGVGTEEGTFTFLPFLWSAGGDLQTFGDAASVKALKLYQDMVRNDKSVSPGVAGWGQTDAYQQFIAQKCAMMINGSWHRPGFVADHVTFKWAVAPWPKDKNAVSILGGENIGIGNTKNVNETWKFVSWLTQPENLAPLLKAAGYLPSRKDMVNDFLTDDFNKAFSKAVGSAKARAYGPKYPQVSEKVWTAFQSVMAGRSTPEEAAKTAGDQIKVLFR